MCLETTYHHYCGHRTTGKQVCQAKHASQHVKKRSLFSRICGGSTPSPKAKCEIRRVEQHLLTPCERCSQNPELCKLIQLIPSNATEQQRLDMVSRWSAQHPHPQLLALKIKALKDRPRAERTAKNFTCSRCAFLTRSYTKRLDNGICCQRGQKEYDQILEAKSAKTKEEAESKRHAALLRQLKAPPPSQKPLPGNPPVLPPIRPVSSLMPPAPVRTRTRRGERSDSETRPPPSKSLRPQTRGRAESEPTTQKPRTRRLASPSKYLDPRGYQRGSTPPSPPRPPPVAQPSKPRSASASNPPTLPPQRFSSFHVPSPLRQTQSFRRTAPLRTSASQRERPSTAEAIQRLGSRESRLRETLPMREGIVSEIDRQIGVMGDLSFWDDEEGGGFI